MSVARLSALAFAAAAVLPWPQAQAVTAVGGAASTGTAMTPSASAPPPTSVKPPATTHSAWPDESWLGLPPLPDVHYAVVPLSTLGVQVWPDDTARNVRAVALDDNGGVLLTFSRPILIEGELDEPLLLSHYWSPTGGNVRHRDVADAGVLPYGSGDFGEGWASQGGLPYLGPGLDFPWWGPPYAWLGYPSRSPSLAQLSPTGRHATSLWGGSTALTGAWPDWTWINPGAQAAIFTPSGIVRLPISGGRTPGSSDHRTLTESAPLWTNGPRHTGSTTHYTSVWAEAVGMNRLGDVIVREVEYDRQSTWSHTIITLEGGPPGNPSYTFSDFYFGHDLHRVAGRIYPVGSPGGTDLLGRVERRADWADLDNWASDIHTQSWTPTASSQTVDPRYLNDLRMVAGYRVKAYGPADTEIVPEAGVLDQNQNWFSLPPLQGRGPVGPQGPTPAQRLVLAGITSGYTVSGTIQAPPVVYGWENFGTTAQPEVRAWWAYAVTTTTSDPGGTTTVSVSWVKDRLAVADPLPKQALRPGPFSIWWDDLPPVWKMNDRLEMVFGDHRLVRNGRVTDLTTLATEGWSVSAARDINDTGIILADCYGPANGVSHPSVAGPALLLPVEWITPAGDPVKAPVEGGNGLTLSSGSPAPEGANEFTYSASGSGSFTVVLKARVTGLAVLPTEVKNQFEFEVDAIDGSTQKWTADTMGGSPVITGEVLTATVSFHGLPQSHNAFGTKRATLRFNGAVVSRQTFEVFFPRDEKNHPGTDHGVSQNWFYYWNQAVGDTNAMWDDSGHTVFGEVPFMHDWGTYAGPTRRINIAPDLKDGDARDYNNLPAPWYWTSRAVSNSGSIVNAGKISGIDAFFVTIKHEQRHVAQITYSEQMPYWQRNGVARDGVSDSGWSWNVPAVDARYNHLDPGSDGAPGGTGAAADTDLDQTHNHTATNHGATGTHFDLGKDLRTGGLDLTGGFRDTPGDPQNTAVEKQAREVETEKDHGKASFDWGNPGKNHQSINNPND